VNTKEEKKIREKKREEVRRRREKIDMMSYGLKKASVSLPVQKKSLLEALQTK
jgi:hypothetical protein